MTSSAIVTFSINPAVDVSTSALRVEPKHKLRCAPARYEPGGGGVNVSRVIKRLGGDSLALLPLGGGMGQLLRRLLAEEGIATRIVDIAGETRTDFSALDRTTHEQYRFVLPGPELAEDEWRCCLDCLASLERPPQYVVASGSLPRGVPQDFYARLARLTADRGARLVLDSCGAALMAAMDEAIYLVKPNLRELGELVGQPLRSEADWREAADEIVATRNITAVALTLGEHGGYLTTRDVQLRAPGLPVAVESAIGAGDSFLAAMVWRLADGAPFDDAFRWGMAAGTAALITPGSELSRKADVERLIMEVRLLTT